MKYKWLHNDTNQKLIIFFNGWGMDESVVQHLKFTSFDVVMFFDYNSLNTDFDFKTLDNYKEINLIAWSMGVMVATLFNINYKNKVAINGTLKPIDDKFGIPNRIYDLTIRGFNEKGAKRFITSMFDEEITLPQCSRNIENQKNELIALKQYKANDKFIYNKILISNNDKIIPTKNQTNFWEINSNIISGHCPFFKFQKWEDLL